jgi:hypothetical protein
MSFGESLGYHRRARVRKLHDFSISVQYHCAKPLEPP